LKKIIFTLLVSIAAFSARAQVGYNYSQYDFGVGATFNKGKTDFAKSTTRPSFSANFTYNQTPFVNFIADLQIGSVNGFDLSKSGYDEILLLLDPAELPYASFTSDYTTVSGRVQLQMGEIMDYSHSQFKNFFKNLYISGGVGVIYSNYKFNTVSLGTSENKGSNVFIPLKVGYELKFFNAYSEPTVKLDLGYQYNYILSDNFDGIPVGGNDAFQQFTVGLKFAIGGSTSYRKQIDY